VGRKKEPGADVAKKRRHRTAAAVREHRHHQNAHDTPAPTIDYVDDPAQPARHQPGTAAPRHGVALDLLQAAG